MARALELIVATGTSVAIGIGAARYAQPTPAADFAERPGAAYLSRHFLHDAVTAPPADIGAQARALGLGALYPFAGAVDATGALVLPDEGRAVHGGQVEAFAAGVRAAGVAARPWVAIVEGARFDARDAAARAAAATTIAALATPSTDGVHVQLPAGDPAGALLLLGDVRARLPAGKQLSVATPPPPAPLAAAGEDAWSPAQLGAVCELADHLVVHTEDRGLAAPLYAATLVGWTELLAATLPAPDAGGCTWSFVVPAEDTAHPWHDPSVESPAFVLPVLKHAFGARALPAGAAGPTVQGAWLMAGNEWAAWERDWLDREPGAARIAEPMPGG
jgi:hypothetical protein